jgi:hypothetical protein
MMGNSFFDACFGQLSACSGQKQESPNQDNDNGDEQRIQILLVALNYIWGHGRVLRINSDVYLQLWA